MSQILLQSRELLCGRENAGSMELLFFPAPWLKHIPRSHACRNSHRPNSHQWRRSRSEEPPLVGSSEEPVSLHHTCSPLCSWRLGLWDGVPSGSSLGLSHHLQKDQAARAVRYEGMRYTSVGISCWDLGILEVHKLALVTFSQEPRPHPCLLFLLLRS